jgi:hypothetical protein
MTSVERARVRALLVCLHSFRFYTVLAIGCFTPSQKDLAASKANVSKLEVG